jgi:hypothetical protein
MATISTGHTFHKKDFCEGCQKQKAYGRLYDCSHDKIRNHLSTITWKICNFRLKFDEDNLTTQKTSKTSLTHKCLLCTHFVGKGPYGEGSYEDILSIKPRYEEFKQEHSTRVILCKTCSSTIPNIPFYKIWNGHYLCCFWGAREAIAYMESCAMCNKRTYDHETFYTTKECAAMMENFSTEQ